MTNLTKYLRIDIAIECVASQAIKQIVLLIVPTPIDRVDVVIDECQNSLWRER
jgi:hypothetical protein